MALKKHKIQHRLFIFVVQLVFVFVAQKLIITILKFSIRNLLSVQIYMTRRCFMAEKVYEATVFNNGLPVSLSVCRPHSSGSNDDYKVVTLSHFLATQPVKFLIFYLNSYLPLMFSWSFLISSGNLCIHKMYVSEGDRFLSRSFSLRGFLNGGRFI